MHDRFPGGIFNRRFWSAGDLITPEEIKDKLRSLYLLGRKIDGFRFLGYRYELYDDDSYETQVYDYLEKQGFSSTDVDDAFEELSGDVHVALKAVIDEPFLIRFDDGDTLEMLSDSYTRYSFSMNRLSPLITGGRLPVNTDANILFQSCIGREITAIDIRAREFTKENDGFLEGPFYRDEGEIIVHEVILWLSNGLGISISGDMDFTTISVITKNNEPATELYKNIKDAFETEQYETEFKPIS